MKRFLLTYFLFCSLNIAANAEVTSAEEMVARIKDAEIESQLTLSLPKQFDVAVVCINHKTYKFENFVDFISHNSPNFSKTKIINGEDFSEVTLSNSGHFLYIYIGDGDLNSLNKNNCLKVIPILSDDLQNAKNWIEDNNNILSKMNRAKFKTPYTPQAQTETIFFTDASYREHMIWSLDTSLADDNEFAKLIEESSWFSIKS